MIHKFKLDACLASVLNMNSQVYYALDCDINYRPIFNL